jgi:hypothetical protein
MNKLTNEEIARVFAMYWGCDVEIDIRVNKVRKIQGVSFNAINELLFITNDGNFGLKHWIVNLLLTPLDKITDEHAIEVAKIILGDVFKNYISSIDSIKYEGKTIGKLKTITCVPSNENKKIGWLDRFINFPLYTNPKEHHWIGIGNINSDKTRTYLTKGITEYSQTFQQLIIWGYAVPLFFGVNHWPNGKTAIELGIAVDKTTLQNEK